MNDGNRMTEAESLLRERATDYRSEYLAGCVRAMTGGTRRHNRIVQNLGKHLDAQIGGRPCAVYLLDMRVKVAAAGLYTYPDVVVHCAPPSFEDSVTDTLLNPLVIFEVLSPSTEAYDRGEKFAHYRRLESLREYVLVAQDRMCVEHHARERDWTPVVLEDPDSMLDLPSIDCAQRLGDIYQRAEFLPAP